VLDGIISNIIVMARWIHCQWWGEGYLAFGIGGSCYLHLL